MPTDFILRLRSYAPLPPSRLCGVWSRGRSSPVDDSLPPLRRARTRKGAQHLNLRTKSVGVDDPSRPRTFRVRTTHSGVKNAAGLWGGGILVTRTSGAVGITLQSTAHNKSTISLITTQPALSSNDWIELSWYNRRAASATRACGVVVKSREKGESHTAETVRAQRGVVNRSKKKRSTVCVERTRRFDDHR